MVTDTQESLSLSLLFPLEGDDFSPVDVPLLDRKLFAVVMTSDDRLVKVKLVILF